MPAIRRAGAVQPRVAEPEDLVVSVIVAGGVQRPFMEQDGDSLGAQAHHPKGDHRPGKVIPANPGKAARANERIDPPPQFAGLNLRLQLAWPGTDDPMVFKISAPTNTTPNSHMIRTRPSATFSTRFHLGVLTEIFSCPPPVGISLS